MVSSWYILSSWVDRWYKIFHTLRLFPFVHSYACSPDLLISNPLCLFLLRPLRRQSDHWPWPRHLYLFSPWATSPFAQGLNSDALLTAPFMRQPCCLSDPFGLHGIKEWIKWGCNEIYQNWIIWVFKVSDTQSYFPLIWYGYHLLSWTIT